jgi:hypothetical protein
MVDVPSRSKTEVNAERRTFLSDIAVIKQLCRFFSPEQTYPMKKLRQFGSSLLNKKLLLNWISVSMWLCE